MPPILSANCHVVEPRHLFADRVPARWRDRAPRVADAPGYGEQWEYEGVVRPLWRNAATAGMAPELLDPRSAREPVRYDDILAGCYDPVARIADMDLDGILAAACYSSPATMGFCGDLFARAGDPELGLACVRAWNDWMIDEWVAADPTRFVPIQLPWYLDPEAAAVEVRRNADRGFRGVAFRNPTDLDLPWMGSGHWDPFLRACEETGTVLCHHTEGASGRWPKPAEGLPYGPLSALFQASVMETVVSWLWGGITVRFPDLRITVAESGGSWLPHLLRRTTWALGCSPFHREGWPAPGRDPIELLQGSFTFSTFDVDVAVDLEVSLGLGGWMLEVDYPHVESTWPATAAHHAPAMAGLDEVTQRALAFGNAASLFRHGSLTSG